jgi:hypothetical protein
MLSRLPTEIFCLSVTIQKLFVVIDLAGNLAFRNKNWELLEILGPKIYFDRRQTPLLPIFVSQEPASFAKFGVCILVGSRYKELGQFRAYWLDKLVVHVFPASGFERFHE